MAILNNSYFLTDCEMILFIAKKDCSSQINHLKKHSLSAASIFYSAINIIVKFPVAPSAGSPFSAGLGASRLHSISSCFIRVFHPLHLPRFLRFDRIIFHVPGAIASKGPLLLPLSAEIKTNVLQMY